MGMYEDLIRQTDLTKRQQGVTANAQQRQQARRQGTGGQGTYPGYGGYPGYGYGGYGMAPGAWTPTPYAQQTPYAQAMIAPASLAAGTQQYGSELDFLADVHRQPWQLAQVSQAVVPQAQASMYGSYAGGLADILGAYYPAAAQVSTAHYPALASMYGTGVGANLQRDLMQMGNEAKSANLYQMLQGLQPMIQAAGQPTAPVGFQTNYGAGVY